MSAPRQPLPRGLVRLTALIVLGGFMAGLDTSLVNVGLATIARDLQTSLSNAQWVVSGYLLSLAAALPAGPWLQRRLGTSRVWLFALIGFTGASLLCAAAPSLPLLVAARLLQGVCGALLVPTGQKIVAEAVGLDRMGGVMSVAGLAIVLAPVIGPALGGLLIEKLSWRWLFLVNVPIGGLAALLAPKALPANKADRASKLDAIGLTLLVVGLPATLLGLTRLGAPGPRDGSGTYLTALGILLLVVFVIDAMRASRPVGRPALLDMGLFRMSHYAAAQATVFFTGLNMFGGLILLPLYYEALRGLSVGSTGLLLLAYGLGALVAMPVAGRLTDRIGSGVTCIGGLMIVVAATIPFVLLPADANLVTVQLLQALRGVGVGLSGIPSMTAVFRAAPRKLGDATTTANILQRVGGSLGSAMVVIVIARVAPILAAIQLAHAMLATAALLALGSALIFTISERRMSVRLPVSS